MLKIKGKNIEITRGNVLPITVTADNDIDGNNYTFRVGDVIRFKIFDSKNINKVYLQKDFIVDEECTEKQIEMTANEMKIGELSNKVAKYWWELELNPDTDNTHTIVGYELDENGNPDPAILTITPEGGDDVQEGGEA